MAFQPQPDVKQQRRPGILLNAVVNEDDEEGERLQFEVPEGSKVYSSEGVVITSEMGGSDGMKNCGTCTYLQSSSNYACELCQTPM